MKKSSVVIIVVASLATLLFCVIPVIGIMIAIAVPGFLRAREISRRNACMENQSKIDGAVQQYILEHRLTAIGHDGGTGFLDFVGDPTQSPLNQTVWMSADDPRAGKAILFGDNEYVRFVSICPAGGFYQLQDPDSPLAVSEYSVYCTLRHRPGVAPAFFHLFPGEDSGMGFPTSGQ
jgi:hypothetical protein